MTTVDSILILGRQPALGLAELESLYGADNLRGVSHQAALLSVAPSDVNFARLGGCIKLCQVVDEFATTNWREVQNQLEQRVPALLATLPDGKIQLGLSAYGFNFQPKQLLALGLQIKKAARSIERSVRLVPNQTPALNSAQVLHNHLTGPLGCEIVLVRDGHKTIWARTVAEQDIASYTLRDRGRPKRDARVGMLPPKLAQIIVNLAGKHAPAAAIQDSAHLINKNPRRARLLDPFCGTGVVLQEALLLGYDVYGTDLEARMTTYTDTNVHWLRDKYQVAGKAEFASGDATTFQWQPPVDLIASETYLGQPFSTLPSPAKLEQVRGTCNVIIEKFLMNIGKQVKSGTRLCLAVPAWQIVPGHFTHLALVDRLHDLGYNRISFEHVRDDQLLYYREDQIVARELLILTKQ